MNWNLASEKPFKQITTMILLMLFSASIFSSMAYLLALLIYGRDSVEFFDANNIDSLMAMKLIQGVFHFSLFVIPALIFAKLSGIKMGQYLKIDTLPKAKHILMAILIIYLSLPLIAFAVELNMKMDLPNWLNGVESWMKEKEESAKLVTDAIVLTDSFNHYLINLLILAILPAIGEEFIFRGFLIRFFANITKNIHINVLIVSVLFSALHLQFYGFLPRLGLGLLLGYLFVWSGSLWIPILVHFLNNSLMVTIYYLYQTNYITQNPDDFGTVGSHYYVLLFSILFGFAFWWFYKNRTPDFELNDFSVSYKIDNVE